MVAGIENFKSQNDDLDVIRRKVGNANQLLVDAIKKSQSATNEFLLWLEGKTSSKTGHSGVGKENYTWYQQNVHLVPLTWEDEVRLLQRELDRAWASLKLEEHNNRDLPQLIAADTPEKFKKLTENGVKRFIGSRNRKF